MKNPLLGAALALMFTSPAVGQHWCGTDELRRQLLQDNPWIHEAEANFEEELREIIANNAYFRDEDLILQIPVVFHILHLKGEENIPDSRILAQIDRLNEDFRALNSDLDQVIAPFQDIVGDVKVEFVLPTRDRFGNCHNGIERIQSVQALLGLSSSKLNQWPRSRYLNVWTARDLDQPGLLGYALLPASATGFLEAFDGVLLRASTVGISDPYLGRTLTHEVGHYLNLLHTWGETNEPGVECGDDGVEDTPITMGTFGCPTDPEDSKVCDPDIYENYQNHMDYSSCPRMYSEGQVERMRATLFANTAERNQLWTEANLITTGVAEGHQATCPPEADFYAVVGTNLDDPTIPFYPATCTGTTVKFMDNSTRAFATEWQWTFEGGNPSSSNARNPTVQYDSPGFKRVTLTVGNAYGSTSRTDDYAVLIGSTDDSFAGTYQESFEGSDGIFPFVESNHDLNHTFWQRYANAGYNGSACARLNSGDRNLLNIINPDNANDIDDLITPNLDLSGMSNVQLSFWYSYNTMTTNLEEVTEKLEIFSSTNCGRTWQQRTSITGADLITSGTIQGPGPWAFRSVSLPGSVLTQNVRFRFRFTSSAYSGDFFIDEINVGGPVGIVDTDDPDVLRIFPNPTHDAFSIQVMGMGTHATEVIVQDLRGAVVYSSILPPAGGMGVELSSRAMGLADGLYVLRVNNALGSGANKLIVGR